MIKLKELYLLTEGAKEQVVEDFIKQTIKGTKFENKVLAVGGYVRDLVRGADAKDLDLVVDMPNGGIEFSNWITKKIGNYKEGSNPVIFEKFLTSQFNFDGVVHNGIDLTGYKIEAVAPRSEVYHGTSRKPDVTQSDLKSDAERRDLSINALYKNISTGEIVDPTGMGLSDIKNRILRPPGNPDVIYTEDSLRLLRIVRFYAKMGYNIPLNLIKTIKKHAPKLQNISSERIQEELNKMLLSSSPEKAIKLLRITGLLDYVVPELKTAYKMTQNSHHKQDVFSHILSVLKNTKPVLIQRLTSLFHDIGKTVTKSVTPTGVHFYSHEIEGSKIAEDVMRRLKYPVELIDAVKLGVKSHMRLKHGGDDAVKLSDKTLRKFKIEMGVHLEDILSVIHADNISHSDASSMPNQIENVKRRLENLKLEKTVTGKPKLPINGKDLISIGIPPGEIYSKIFSELTEKWYDNPNISREEALNIAKNIAVTK